MPPANHYKYSLLHLRHDYHVSHIISQPNLSPTETNGTVRLGVSALMEGMAYT